MMEIAIHTITYEVKIKNTKTYDKERIFYGLKINHLNEGSFSEAKLYFLPSRDYEYPTLNIYLVGFNLVGLI